MAYTKTNWIDGTTPLSADNMNHIEQGIANNDMSLTENATEHSFLDQLKLKFIYGAIGDGLSHPLSSLYATLADAQIKYPCATALTDEVDWCAIQTALNTETNIVFPLLTFIVNDKKLIVTKFGATLNGASNLYNTSTIQYNGVGTLIQIMGSANYVSLKHIHLKAIPAVSTDYFNTGSVGIDTTDGAASIVMDSCWLEGFETLVNSNYNSFYNKFTNNRFERFKEGLYHFSINNLVIEANRFTNFNNAINVNGAAGTLSVEKNYFEVFNGTIINSTGAEQGAGVFQKNYIETYDTLDLPTNFPVATYALGNHFGGNSLIVGSFRSLSIKYNDFQIAGVFRIGAFTSCDYLESIGNNIHIQTGGNLDRMYSNAASFKSYYINDVLGTNMYDGTYNRTYAAVPLAVTSPFNNNYYYDCVLGKELIAYANVYTPTLTNGWANSSDTAYGNLKITLKKEGLYLQGVVTGTAKTSNVVITLPADKRPVEFSTLRTKCIIKAISDFGTGVNVCFLYDYTDGTLTMQGTPTSVVNICLDGLIIPIRV